VLLNEATHSAREFGGNLFSVEVYRPEFFDGVASLWEGAFPDDPPWNRAEVVIPAKQIHQPELFLVCWDGAKVLGSALGGYDGHRGWLYSVAVLPSHCRQGIGSMLVHELENRLAAFGCSRIKLQVPSLNLALMIFYHSLGYNSEHRICMGKRL
jgi:ribosomal protein S18 acetylase RimI-like enzyme